MADSGIIIKGILPMTTIDYKGKMASTIFLQGCNFGCPFCHNPELVPIVGEEPFLKSEEVLAYLEEHKEWVDAVCISGGEPTIHKGLPDFLRKLKTAGFFVKVQTNGTNPEMIKTLISERIINYISMDIKAPPEKYEMLAGKKCDIAMIKESAKIIMNGGIEYSFHTTVSPQLSALDIIKIGEWLRGAKTYYLQQFRPEKTLDPAYATKKPYESEELNAMAGTVRGFFKKVVVEGA